MIAQLLKKIENVIEKEKIKNLEKTTLLKIINFLYKNEKELVNHINANSHNQGSSEIDRSLTYISLN